MCWDLSSLRKAVKKLYGQEHLERLSPSLDSIVERQEFCRLYFHEAKDTLEAMLYDKTDEMSLLDLVLPVAAEERKIFENCKFRARAHVTSCLQNMHSVSDILGHVIYYSLKLEKAKQERDICLAKISKWIEEDCALKPLHTMLNNLVKHDDYKYLKALVNHSKHRSIIEPYFNVTLRKHGRGMQELRFRGFVHDFVDLFDEGFLLDLSHKIDHRNVRRWDAHRQTVQFAFEGG